MLLKLQCPGLLNSTAARLCTHPGRSSVQPHVCLPMHVAIMLHATKLRLLTWRPLTSSKYCPQSPTIRSSSVCSGSDLAVPPDRLPAHTLLTRPPQAAYLRALLQVCMVLLHCCNADIHGLLLHLCCHVCVLHQGVLGHSAGAVRPSSGTIRQHTTKRHKRDDEPHVVVAWLAEQHQAMCRFFAD